LAFFLLLKAMSEAAVKVLSFLSALLKKRTAREAIAQH
jgi:hypothetical protein